MPRRRFRWTLRATMVLIALSAFGAYTWRSARERQPIARAVRLLRTSNPGGRRQAALNLSRMGPAAKSAEPALIAALTDPSPPVREAAAFALLKVGSTDPMLTRALAELAIATDPAAPGPSLLFDPWVGLARYRGRTADLLPAARAALRSGDPAAQARGARLLCEFAAGKWGDRSTPGLADALLDALAIAMHQPLPSGPAWPRRRRSSAAHATIPIVSPAPIVQALARMGPDARRRTASLLLPMLHHPGPWALSTARMLLSLEPEDRQAVEVLTAGLRDQDDRTRITALYLLKVFGPRAEPAASAIAELMAGPDRDRPVAAITGEIAGTLALNPAPAVRAPNSRSFFNEPANRPEDAKSIRELGAKVLGAIGERGQRRAVERLKVMLREEGPETWRGAAFALGEIGPPAAAAAPELARLLAESPGEAVGEELTMATVAGAALIRIGHGQEADVARPIVAVAVAGGTATRERASLVLKGLGPSMAAVLVGPLRGQDVELRRWAASTIDALGATPESVASPLTVATNDPDPLVAARSARALGRLGAAARPAVLGIARLLDDPNPNVRRAGVEALGRLGTHAEEAAGPLLEATDDPERWVAEVAHQVLPPIATRADRYVPKALDSLRAPEPATRRRAAFHLGRVGATAPGVGRIVQGLARALDDPSAPVREMAASALGRIGPSAEEASVALALTLQDDRSAGVRRAAAYGIGRVAGPEESVPRLGGALGDDSPAVRRAAARALGRIGPGAEGAIAKLATVLGSPRQPDDVRRVAADAIGRIGPPDGVAVEALAAALAEAESPYIRREAAAGLGRLGVASGPAMEALFGAFDDEDGEVRLAVGAAAGSLRPSSLVLPVLLKRLANDSPSVRESAARGLAVVEPDEAREAVSQLALALADPEGRVRLSAAYALWRLGTIARPAAPAIRDALDDPSPLVREYAADALRGLDTRVAPL